MDLQTKQQRLLQKLSNAENLLRMREACQEFLSSTACDVIKCRQPNSALELFQSILLGTSYTPAQTESLMARFLGEHRLPLIVAVAVPEDQEQEPSFDETLQALSGYSECWSFVHQGRLVCIFSALEKADAYAAYPVIQAMARRKLRVGMSRPFSTLASLPTYYDQAKITLKTAQILHKRARVYTADHFYILRLFMGLQCGMDLMNFCLPEIRVLSEYDRKNHTELCETLQTYLDNSKNTVLTAKQLNIHRNTVLYRINQCHDILGPEFDFNDGIINFMTTVSLHILEFELCKKATDHDIDYFSGLDGI